MKLEAYESIDGKLFKAKDEAVSRNETIKLNKLLSSIDGWLENEYPNREGIVLELLYSIKKYYGSLSSKKLNELIGKVSQLVETEY